MKSSAGNAKSGVNRTPQQNRLEVSVLARRFLKWAVRPAVFFLFSFSTAYAAGWVSTMPADSPDQDLCHALLDRLNHVDTHCLDTAIDEYPGFATPPWETLDPIQHLELVAKLTGYRGGSDAMTPQQWSAKLEGAKHFSQSGGTLKVWHTRLLNFFDSNGQFPAPIGDQTIILMSSTLGLSNCPSHPSLVESSIFLVLPDLSGPDVRVKPGVASGLATSHLLLYKGRILFVDHDVEYIESKLKDGSNVVIYQIAKQSGVHLPVCWFEHRGNNRNSREK